jgi:16S rRNA (cytosine967-C5)-methyltransferase
MRPASRIQAVIEIYEKIGAAKIPMDGVVGDYMRQRRYIGAKDRADIAERTYSVMRAWRRLTWWLERAGAEITPRNLLIANTILAEGASEQKMKDFFDGSKFAPAELDNDEIALFERLKGKSLDDPDMPEGVRVECPEEYEAELRDYFGADFAAELKAMQNSATLDMRANVFVAPREKVKESLAKDGVKTDETPYSPWGLRARDKAYLSKTKAFSKGLVEIQDEGSQLIAHVCGAQRGMQVLDFCAGGGGKTLALAAAMERKGRIVAMDNDERRLQKGKERFRKAQVADIIEVRPMSDERHRKWLRRQKETFDIVLLDVPCTGTGTWRRNPDKRWKLYGPDLNELVKTQTDILDKAAGCVKPGGKLVYATCSILPAENENQVEAFLQRHPEYEVQPVDEKLGNPYMRLTPLRHNTDGFFAAVLVKKAA